MKKALTIFVAIIMVLPSFCVPEIIHATTLAEFEKQVENYTNELTNKKNQVAQNEQEIAKIKSQINTTENQITTAQNNIVQLEKDIDALYEKIDTKKNEVKKIINFVQVSSGVSSYLEYIFGAESFTDLIYRAAVAEQMSSYNEKLVKEYNELIEQSKKKQEDLKTKSEELAGLQEQLSTQKAGIEADNAVLRGSMPSVEERIKEAKLNVEYYKNLGCGKNEDIQACQYRISKNSIPAVAGYYKPIPHGKIVQTYQGLSHLGYDIVSTTGNASVPIYPIAQGQVFLIYSDSCTSSTWCARRGYSCNGNAKIVVIRHNVGNGYIYSSYVHLASYGNIQEGQIVFPTTILGYMGTTGCSTGTHLHLEMTTCYWKKSPSLGAGGCDYSKYERSTINPATYIGIPNQYGYKW